MKFVRQYYIICGRGLNFRTKKNLSMRLLQNGQSTIQAKRQIDSKFCSAFRKKNIYEFSEMRREFILVMLGIICISTLSSLLTGYVQIETDKILLDTVVGAVGAGNFSYWQLGHTGPLLVELTSLSGDADLYVSDSVRPSYETDKNNFSSVTCGPDMVSIPSEFPRPIGIGVFGHWSHFLSEYSIQVFLDTSAVISEEHLLAIEKVQQGLGEKYGELEKRKEMPAKRKAEDEQASRVLKLFGILNMIFEMFVL